jgi:hypothetical protein
MHLRLCVLLKRSDSPAQVFCQFCAYNRVTSVSLLVSHSIELELKSFSNRKAAETRRMNMSDYERSLPLYM